MVNEFLSQGKGNLSVRGSRLLGTFERQGHVGCTDDSVVLVHDTEAQRVAPGWQFHIDVIWQSLLLYASEVGGLKRRFYRHVLLPSEFPIGSIRSRMKLQGKLLAASVILRTDRAGIHNKVNPHLHLGSRSRWRDARVKRHAGRSRRSVLHRHADFRIPLFGGLRVLARAGCIVAMPRAHRCSGTIHFHLDLVVLAIRLAFGGITEQIVRGAVLDAERHRMVQLVPIDEEWPASLGVPRWQAGGSAHTRRLQRASRLC